MFGAPIVPTVFILTFTHIRHILCKFVGGFPSLRVFHTEHTKGNGPFWGSPVFPSFLELPRFDVSYKVVSRAPQKREQTELRHQDVIERLLAQERSAER